MRHSPRFFHGAGRKARPDDKTVCCRIAGRHTQLEWGHVKRGFLVQIMGGGSRKLPETVGEQKTRSKAGQYASTVQKHRSESFAEVEQMCVHSRQRIAPFAHALPAFFMKLSQT